MMKHLDCRKVTCCLGVFAIIFCQAQLASAAETKLDVTVDQETAARRQILDDLLAQQTEIEKMVESGSFQEADQACSGLEKQLAAIPGTLAKRYHAKIVDLHDSIKKDWIKNVMSRARALAKDGKYEEAITLASSVSGIDEKRGTEINSSFIADCRARIKAQNYDNATNLSQVDKNFDSDRELINRLMREAETFYNNQKYEEAVARLEHIYILDPLNVRATALLDKTYRKVRSFASMRHQADSEAIMAQDEWSWIEPIYFDNAADKVARPVETKLAENTVVTRMKNIVFPKIDFTDIDISALLKFLSTRSKSYDPEGIGVTIIQSIPENVLAANPRMKKINMTFSNIPMNEVLRYITQDLGLKYKIEDGNVYVGTNIDEMRTQYFTVRDDMISNITGMDAAAVESDQAQSAPAPAGPGGRAAGDAEKATVAQPTNASASSGEMKNYFDLRGVTFPEGSSISYNRRTNRLVVINTDENLRKLDELLRQLSVIETPMVMTEVKFIEVNEKDWNELGFDWTFNLTNGKPSGSLAGGWGTFMNSKNVRFGENTALVQGINIFPKFEKTILGATPNLNLTVHAISQNTRSEVLSTPRLITKSGTNASIKMITKTRYPDSWEAPSIEVSGDNNVVISFPVPELGDPEEVGIKMALTPTVNPDNYTILLELHPEVITFLGSENSSYSVAVQQGTVDPTTGELNPNQVNKVFPIWMAEFGRRSLDVNVKVYDGETIVLGGVVNNTIERWNDKLPFLGSIPLIGRFFADKQEQSTKVNLLIFVTARLINNDGRPLRRAEVTGIPNFNY